jgi:FADH2 O2-dependent halogenase
VKTGFDMAVIGSGFAGSLAAMIARRIGLSVVLLEKGKHPRMMIGESSTPLSNLLLEEIAERYDLPKLRPLTKWGAWQKMYPHVSCGLKRGFSFIHHDLTQRERHMLVAASPHDGIADTHWFRADFDSLLVEQAKELGVEYLDEIELTTCRREEDRWRLAGTRNGMSIELHPKFLLDATGPRGFLYQSLELGESNLPSYPKTSALYAHFTDVRLFEEVSQSPLSGEPYPLDAAALHHVFSFEGEGGWMWVLRFNNGLTSAGVGATEKVARHFRFADGEPAWQRLLDYLPEVKKQFDGSRAQTHFTHLASVPFLSSQIAGDGWALLPTAAGFIDPLLSTGFPLTLLGITRFGRILEEAWGKEAMSSRLASYASQTRNEILAAARLIAALYRNMNQFRVFRATLLLYFAAASYSETVRRLDKPEMANSFLLDADSFFGPECRRLLGLAQSGIDKWQCSSFEQQIYALIERFDVAGLCKRPKNCCYPVEATDLMEAAHKVGATPDEIVRLLSRSGFYCDQEIPA